MNFREHGCSDRDFPRPRSIQAILWLGLAASAILFLWAFNPRKDGLLLRVLSDAGHAPLFGIVAIALLRFLSIQKARVAARPEAMRGPLGGASVSWRASPYLWSWALTAFLGAATEAVQYFGARDASPADLLRDMAGATSFLLIAFAFERGSGRSGSARGATVLGAGAILALSSYPALITTWAFVRRNAAFPTICDFESAALSRLTIAQDAEMSIVPRTGQCGDGRRWARLILHPAPYSGFGIREPFPDWTGCETLAFDVYSELAADVEMVLRIHDRAHDQSYRDRFNRVLTIRPGCNSIRIPLADVREAPERRAMEMSEIAGVSLFMVQPSESVTLYLDAFRLESGASGHHRPGRSRSVKTSDTSMSPQQTR